MERRFSALISFVCFAATVWLAFRAITLPEARLWDELVRPPFRTAFLGPSSWSNWVYALLAKRAIGLFRLSEFTLRLPAVVAGAVYLTLLPRRPIWLVAAVVPVALGVFSTATGLGLALAFCAAAVRWTRPAPLLLGIAIAAAPIVVLPVVAYAVWRGIDRVAIPAVVTAFILLIVPLSHARRQGPPTIGSREVEATRNSLLPLRGQAVDLAVSPDYLPLARFYKDRLRQRGWTITDGTRPGVVVFNQ